MHEEPAEWRPPKPQLNALLHVRAAKAYMVSGRLPALVVARLCSSAVVPHLKNVANPRKCFHFSMLFQYLNPGPTDRGLVSVTRQYLISTVQLSPVKVNSIGTLSLHCYCFFLLVFIWLYFILILQVTLSLLHLLWIHLQKSEWMTVEKRRDASGQSEIKTQVPLHLQMLSDCIQEFDQCSVFI